jgi:copper chaperone CopZ
METYSFKVDGMHCGGCANRVHNALAFTEGVAEVGVSLETRMVEVRFDRTRTSVRDMLQRIRGVGYEAVPV